MKNQSENEIKKVLVTGGAGYVGAVLIPKLLQEGYEVVVLDLYIFGDNVLEAVADHPKLTQVKGDIRDRPLLKKMLMGCQAVIHLACISNDPSFELNPELGKSINYDAFLDLVRFSRDGGVRRFIYASSSSVYGVKETPNVTEELPLEPLTDYSKYKALCEDVLLKEVNGDFIPLILRPATVCGYSPRQRLDLTVNILTNHAFHNKKIRVFGGRQMRPNIHIDDVSDLYVKSLEWPEASIKGKIYNAGYENHTVLELAHLVRDEVGQDITVEVEPTNDNRSYHISSEKIKNELGFCPKRSIKQSVRDLMDAYRKGFLPNSKDDPKYFNVKMMTKVGLI